MITQYLILAVCLLAGQIFHLLIKAGAMRKRAKAGNIEFSFWKDFIALDIFEIAATFVGGIIVMLALKEIVGFYAGIQDYLRILFILLGYSGSSLVLHVLSKAEKKITSEIDSKTNILDQITNNMEHWVFQPALSSPNDVVLTVGSQNFNQPASGMANTTGGIYYTQTILGQVHLCAALSTFSAPEAANIRIAGSQQTNFHIPVKRPK